MFSLNCSKIKSSRSGATILRVPIYTLGGDKLRIRSTVFEITTDIYDALSFTGYNGDTMKSQNDILMLNNIVNDLGYTGVGDKPSKRKTFFTKKLPKLAEEIHKRTIEEITVDSDSDSQGEGVKIIIPSNKIDIYARLQVLLGLKLSGHFDTLTEASNLIDKLYRIGDIQNEQQYQNALSKFST